MYTFYGLRGYSIIRLHRVRRMGKDNIGRKSDIGEPFGRGQDTSLSGQADIA